MKKLVVIESPFAGDEQSNTSYARRALLDSFLRGEYPYASHLLYPQVLMDTLPSERSLGLDAGWAWTTKADLMAVYTDRGISPGMEHAMRLARALGIPIEMRTLEN